MSQKVETPFGAGTVVDRESVRGRVSYKVEGPGFSTWIEATAMPMDFEFMPDPDDIQDNSTVLPYNPEPQSWTNPSEQNIQPGQEINPQKRTSPADSVDFRPAEGHGPGPDPALFATGGMTPEDIQAKLGPKYVNAFVEHDFTSLQARLEEHPDLVLAEYRERVAELVAEADQEHLERVGRNEYLESSDPQIREAAWKDVAAKARRLRRGGQVNTRAAHPDRIASQVTGDHGTYEVIVIRSSIFTGSGAVDAWSCECPWGQWAFKREHSFVGRLCSHAYATLMELQSLNRSKTRTKNPVWKEDSYYNFSSRTADRDLLQDALDYSRDNVDDTLRENGLTEDDPEGQELARETWRSSLGYYADEYGITIPDEHFERYASREAEIVDLRPVGWDPYSRNLMNQLRELWEEGRRPGRQEERNQEVRELVQELRDRGFDTNGIVASLRESFMNRPMGYGDIPDYGTSEDYVIQHELRHREDVTEMHLDYTPGTDDGVVQDINDGRERTADFEDYGSGDEFGGDENPYYVDPAEREDWDDPLPDDASEEDIVANFQRNAGHLLGGTEGVTSGVDGDIAAAAEAHLRTAGRNFTMAEQQELIDETDGNPYDRSKLRLRGTHYEGGAL